VAAFLAEEQEPGGRPPFPGDALAEEVVRLTLALAPTPTLTLSLSLRRW